MKHVWFNKTGALVLLMVILASSWNITGRKSNKTPQVKRIQQNAQTALFNIPNFRKAQGYYYSFSNSKAFFEEPLRYAETLKIKPRQDIKAFVVNHHLLAAGLVGQIFKYAETNEKLTVVLVSPNHFMQGGSDILTSEYDFKTPFGVLEADLDTIAELTEKDPTLAPFFAPRASTFVRWTSVDKSQGRLPLRRGGDKKVPFNPILKIEEGIWQKEHGITNLVAFIKKTMPNAKIIPIMIKDTCSEETGKKFIDALIRVLPKKSLMIGSFDFSHTLPTLVADFHDQKSITVLDTLDFAGASSLDIDSRPGIKAVLYYLKQIGTTDFQIVNHANAAMATNNYDLSDATSYITGFWTDLPPTPSLAGGGVGAGVNPPPTRITILALGDLMLDRYVRWKIVKEKDINYPFKNLERFVSGSDIAMANLEGPISDFKPRAPTPNNLIFTFDPIMTPVLKKLGFNILGLANNHTLNQGEEGLKQTKTYLTNNQIEYFGDPKNSQELSIIKNIRGKKLALIGYSEYGTNNFDKIIEEIKLKRKEADYVIVFPHFGDEYRLIQIKRQEDKARQMIDAGADMVIGTHPHVVQPIEIYKGKFIFYSLGNFVFDQTFSVPTQQGLGVGLVIENGKVTAYLFPHETVNLQVKLMMGDKGRAVLGKMAEKSKVSEEIKEQIRRGKVTLINN